MKLIILKYKTIEFLMYLGREWKDKFVDLPKGMYIINNNKIFKTK